MPNLQVDGLLFSFKANVIAQKYDSSQHYIVVWNGPPGGKKAMDVVAIEEIGPQSTTWLIEAKDFRIITFPPKPSNIGGLAQFVADKAADTLAGLVDAHSNAIVAAERQHATKAIASIARRVVLHLEPHIGAHSALFPAGFAANVLQKLRQLVKTIDAEPLVLKISNTSASGVPWLVS